MKNPTWQQNEEGAAGRIKIEGRHDKGDETGIRGEEHAASVDMKICNIYSKTRIVTEKEKAGSETGNL